MFSFLSNYGKPDAFTLPSRHDFILRLWLWSGYAAIWLVLFGVNLGEHMHAATTPRHFWGPIVWLLNCSAQIFICARALARKQYWDAEK